MKAPASEPISAEDLVRVELSGGRSGEHIGLRVRRRCEVCETEFLVYPSDIYKALARGRVGPRFCSSECFERTRTGPKCVKCGGPNLRGARTRICQECIESSPGALRMIRARLRIAECPEGKRWCTACDEFLPPAQFASAENVCEACRTSKDRAGHLRRTYDLEPEEYERLLRAQDGRCAICQSTPKKRPLMVDHEHRTGRIRGLLCFWCNHRLLGGARERTDVLRRAIEYLEDPPAPGVLGDRFAPPKKKAARR